MTSTLQNLFFSLDKLYSDVKWYEGSFDLQAVGDVHDHFTFQIASFSEDDRFQELHDQMEYFLTEGPKYRTYIRMVYEKLNRKFLETSIEYSSEENISLMEIFEKLMDHWKEAEVKIWSLLIKPMSLSKWPRITDLVDQLVKKLQCAHLAVWVAAEKLKMELDEMELRLQETKSSYYNCTKDDSVRTCSHSNREGEAL